MHPPTPLKTVPVVLADGLIAELRPVLPADAQLLEEGFGGLSDLSRYARFGTGVDHLTNRELRYLTNIDLVNHVAWGATIEDQPAGIGRYVMLPNQHCAELAVAVVDRFQRKGLGRTLFEALASVARFDSVPAFCFEVAPSNEAVIKLLRDIAGRPVDPNLLQRAVPLVDIPAGVYEGQFVQLIQEYRAV